MTRVWSSLVLAAALAGCEPETERNVQYWLDHPEERAAVLAVCSKGPAAEAEHQARYRAYWERKVKPREESQWRTSSRP